VSAVLRRCGRFGCILSAQNHFWALSGNEAISKVGGLSKSHLKYAGSPSNLRHASPSFSITRSIFYLLFLGHPLGLSTFSQGYFNICELSQFLNPSLRNSEYISLHTAQVWLVLFSVLFYQELISGSTVDLLLRPDGYRGSLSK
jgi:hypothetical protein